MENSRGARGWKLVRAADFVTLARFSPRETLLTLVGKYSRGLPTEKLGKYPGNSTTKWTEFNFLEISSIPISLSLSFSVYIPVIGIENIYTEA